MNSEKEIKRILFYQAKAALDALREDELLSNPWSWDNLQSLLRTILVERQHLILFLGAGTSISIKTENVSLGKSLYKPLSWDGLLTGLFHTLDDSKKRDFLEDQSLDYEDKVRNVRDDIDNWFEKIKFHKDKPTLAWHLRLYFKHDDKDNNERNIKLYELVSKALESTTYSSRTIEQIVKLPFNDIITTNFDFSIEEFLKKENQFRVKNKDSIKKFRDYEIDELNFSPIYNGSSFLKSVKAQSKHRVFYIHGKADKDGRNFLVFDKFDFAKLIAEKDSVLEYLIGQILGSAVIYFGFGLDDQTFNYIQERLRKIFNKNKVYHPYSYVFSTQKSKTEIDAFEKMHIKVITYRDHDKLPVIIEHINTICEYFRQFPEQELEIKIPSDEDIAGQYRNSGRESYLAENHEESLKKYRLAFASLLFKNPVNPASKEQWKYDKNQIEIRRQLVLNLSKLRWQDDASFKERTYLLEGTINRAEKLLEKYEKNIEEGKISGETKTAIQAQRASINVLRARIKAHEGNMKESFDTYNDFEISFKNVPENQQFLDKYTELLEALNTQSYRKFYEKKLKEFERELNKIKKSRDTDDKKLEKETKLRERFYNYEINENTLLLGYSYIFAREQRKRHNLFLGEREDIKLENNYRENYQNLIRQMSRKDNQEYFTDELAIPLQTLGGVLVIGLWEIASRFVRYASIDLLPNDSDEFNECIDKAIEIFDEDEENFSKPENQILLKGGDRVNILPSTRWQTKMYRHKCRAYMMRWAKNENILSGSGDKNDLLSAFTAFKKALDLSEKTSLKAEFIKNCLESARMNTLVMAYTTKERPGYALSESACYYYLSQSIEVIHELLRAKNKKLPSDLALETLLNNCRKDENWNIWWLMIFILKTASYFKLISDNETRPTSSVYSKKALREFLNLDLQKTKEIVIENHKLYSKTVMKKGQLDQVIKRYEKDFKKLSEIISKKLNIKNIKS